MFSFQATDKATMSGVGIREGRATVADLLRAAGSGGAAPVANPSLLSSIHATNLAARALLASSLSVEEKAYVASRMGTLEPLRQQRSLDSILGQQRAALVKLAAGRRLIEQAKQSLNLEATMRAQITAPAILPAAARTPITPLQAQAPVLTTPNSPLAQLSPPLAQLNPPLAQPKQAPPKPKFEPLKVLPQQDTKGNFPVKLHQMLSDLEKIPGGSEIASFLPHGRTFAIHKPREFVRHVMPKYFKMGRFSSFQRQLNLYDFQRITEGVDKGAYSHPMFLYGQQQATLSMKRNKIKGVKKAKEAAQKAAAAKLEEASASSHNVEGDDDDSV